MPIFFRTIPFIYFLYIISLQLLPGTGIIDLSFCSGVFPAYSFLRSIRMTGEIRKKIQYGLDQRHLDGLLVAGPENLAYTVDIVLPFARQYPDRPTLFYFGKDGQTCLVCPLDWAEAAADQGYSGRVITYGENQGRQPQVIVQLLAEAFQQMGIDAAAIGLDEKNVSAALEALLHEQFPQVTWQEADAMLSEMRCIKTTEEIHMLEEAAVIADKGTIGMLNHLEGTVNHLPYTMAEIAERTRVHSYEHMSSGVGHLCAVQGKTATIEYSPATTELIQGGNFLRIDYNVHYHGYWCKSGRMMVAGEPSKEQLEAYAQNISLKATAVKALRAGVPAKTIFQTVQQASKESGIPFREESGVGHGVGRSEAEPPYLTPDNETLLQAGMVIAVDVVTYGPQRELLHSIDIYELTKEGSRLLSWYKNWDRLYAVNGIRSTH
jgi:Xaa-Pro aminopeptidase